MISAIIPTSYFPSIEYFAFLIKYKEISIEVQESFPKQTFRNRCSILSSNGKLNLTVPIAKNSNSKQLTRDIKISYDSPWQKTHKRSIESAYNSSAFFLYFKDDFNFVFEKKHIFLVDLNTEIIMKIAENIGLLLKLNQTESFNKLYPEQDDFRNCFVKNTSSIPSNSFPSYFQVFDSKFGFSANLSILDLLFNEGNESLNYLSKINLPA